MSDSMSVPELALQAHFPRSKHDRLHHGHISGVYYGFTITSFNGKQMMGPRDLYIFTTRAGGPNANVELLLAAKGSKLPEEKWSSDELTPPVPYTRDGFYAVLRGGPFHQFQILPIPGHRYATQMEYDDSRSLTTYTLADITLGYVERWSTYMLYWDESFGSSEEDHIKEPCVDAECDSVNIQPWSKGPYSVQMEYVAARPICKSEYIPIEKCIPPTCYHVCIDQPSKTTSSPILIARESSNFNLEAVWNVGRDEDAIWWISSRFSPKRGD